MSDNITKTYGITQNYEYHTFYQYFMPDLYICNNNTIKMCVQ